MINNRKFFSKRIGGAMEPLTVLFINVMISHISIHFLNANAPRQRIHGVADFSLASFVLLLISARSPARATAIT